MGKRATAAAIYDEIARLWPRPLEKPTADQAVAACRRLYRHVTGRTWSGDVRVTSGNRSTWISRGVLIVNPTSGWKDLVHDLSHRLHQNVSEEAPHSPAHARLERRLVKEVLRRGWLEPRKPLAAAEPPPADPIAVKLQVADAKLKALAVREKRWVTKHRRAQSALTKLSRQRRAIERHVAKLSADTAQRAPDLST